MITAHVYVVQPGNTLSQIAASYGVSWQSIWRASDPPVSNPNLIFVGERLTIPVGGSESDVQPSAAPVTSPSPSDISGGLSAVSGGSFESCVISRESGGDAQVMNSSGHYGLFQFSESTWTEAGGSPSEFGHASPAYQQTVFNRAYAMWGVSPWQPSDGCTN